MKTIIHALTPAFALVALVAASHAAEEKNASASAEKMPEKKERRVISVTPGEAERRVRVGPRAIEKEKVTFLGVETSPVSNVVAAQLGLAKGSGLVVNHVVPDSAAAGVLQENDILLRLNDQILIETRQLAVLIRLQKEGQEVALTFLRGGKEQTAKVKLGTKEVPKVTGFFDGPVRQPLAGSGPGFAWSNGEGGGRPAPFPIAPDGQHREDVDRVLSLIRPGRDGEPVRIQIDRHGGPGFRAIRVNTANSNLVYSDEEGSLEITTQDGRKSVVAKDAKGEQVFAGPVNTPAERKAMPDAVRRRLEKLEGMHDVVFHTDADFQGADAKVLQPSPRGINLPIQPERMRRAQVFF